MWWVKTDSLGEDRGGFQNRDVGRSFFDENYGPEFGVDYARFADPPDIKKDLALKHYIQLMIGPDYRLIVRNGFVIVKGQVRDELLRRSIIETIRFCEGVVEVISDLKLTEGEYHE